MKDATIAVHGGQGVDKDTHSRALPIYQTASYLFDNTEHAAALFGLTQAGNIYTRLQNPTTDVLEKRISMLDKGVGAIATASGMSAIMYSVLNIVSAGDEIVSSTALYGGTYTLFPHLFKNMGINAKFVSTNKIEDYEKAITSKTKLIYAETLANPKLNILDVEKLAELAHSYNIPLIVDNTVPTPYLLKPVDFGADIVVYSATKFLGGHGTTLAGLLVDSGKFDWEKSGKFPGLVEPDETYHGVSYTKNYKNMAYIIKARVSLMRDTGAVLSPMSSFLITQGMETLHVRMKQHCENALKVAKFLESHKNVAWVTYPGLPSHNDYNLVEKYLPKGQGAMIGFGIKGGKEAGAKFINNVKLLSHLANIGDAKSLVIHPASTTHAQLTEEEQLACGVSPDYIRLSIGIEDIEDILEDIDNALNNIQ